MRKWWSDWGKENGVQRKPGQTPDNSLSFLGEATQAQFQAFGREFGPMGEDENCLPKTNKTHSFTKPN
jgi:hypothetical protein